MSKSNVVKIIHLAKALGGTIVNDQKVYDKIDHLLQKLSDRELCDVVTIDPLLYRRLCDKQKTWNVSKAACIRQFSNMRYCPHQSDDFIIPIIDGVSGGHGIVHHVNNPSNAVQLAAIRRSPSIAMWITNQTLDVQMELLNGYTRYINTPHPEIKVIMALSQ